MLLYNIEYAQLAPTVNQDIRVYVKVSSDNEKLNLLNQIRLGFTLKDPKLKMKDLQVQLIKL